MSPPRQGLRVGHEAAGIDDALQEPGHRLDGEPLPVHLDKAPAEIHRYGIAVPDLACPGADQRQEPGVDGVPVEDPRKRLCDDDPDASPEERERRVLPGRAAPEVAARHHDVALPDLPCKFISRPLKRMLRKFRGIIDRQEPARDDRVSIDIIAEFPYPHILHTSLGSVISP